MKSFIRKTTLVFSLFFLLSSCNNTGDYLYNTPNSSLSSIDKDESINILSRTSTSKYNEDELKNHLLNELYKDIVTSFNGKDNQITNVLYSPLCAFINLLIIDQTTSTPFLSSYNLSKEDSSTIFKEINKLRNVEYSKNSYFKFTDMISFYNILELNEEYLKTLNDEYLVSSYLGKDALDAQKKIFQKIKEDLDLDVKSELPDHEYGNYILSALRFKENFDFGTYKHEFSDINNVTKESDFAKLTLNESYFDESSNILSFKGDTNNFNLTFITTLDGSSINNLNLSNFNLNINYNKDKEYEVYFPHLNIGGEEYNSNIYDVIENRDLLLLNITDKTIKSNQPIILADMYQINNFELNEDGFEGYSVTIADGAPGSSEPPITNKYYFDRPFYLIISLKNDLPIFSMKVNKI